MALKQLEYSFACDALRTLFLFSPSSFLGNGIFNAGFLGIISSKNA